MSEVDDVNSASSGEKYAHLLAPIRYAFLVWLLRCLCVRVCVVGVPHSRRAAHRSDLAQNWQVDIAAELEDYVGELEHIAVSFGDHTQLNFTQGKPPPDIAPNSVLTRWRPQLRW